MRVTPDDEVYRVNTVWLGPSGLTFPWTARYLAYATWLITLLVVLFVEAVTPLTVHVPVVSLLRVTARPDVAVAPMANGASPKVFPPSASNVIAWLALAMPKLCATSGAALKFASPDWLAVIVHEPAPVI